MATTAKKVPDIATLAKSAMTMQKAMAAHKAANAAAKPQGTAPAATVQPQPKKLSVDEYARLELPKVTKAIAAAMKAKQFKTTNLWYPDCGRSDAFLGAMTRLLPPPLRAVDDSTYGWDATDFYAISWQPSDATGNDCDTVTKALLAKAKERREKRRKK